jgi:hypothetical protein
MQHHALQMVEHIGPVIDEMGDAQRRTLPPPFLELATFAF